MSKAILKIIIAVLTLVASVAIVIAYKQTQKIAETKANVQHQIDSLTSISEKYELVRTDFHATNIGATARFKSHSIALGDTMMAEIFIRAFDIHSIDGRKSRIVYQILSEEDKLKLGVLDSSSMSNFFSDSFPIDSSEYNADLPAIKYVPKNRGRYFLRGYIVVPTIVYKNKPSEFRLPLESRFDVY